MRLTQITTVKGRREHVAKHLARWLESGIDELVLVDYACPQQTGLWLLQQTGRDPRITVLQVPPALAGSYFCLTRARNLGALAARHELFLFMDADCWASPAWVDEVRQRMDRNRSAPDLLVSGVEAYTEATVYAGGLPFSWVKDGQCLVRSAAFHDRLHGYAEKHSAWGGESYDLYIRAAQCGARMGLFDPAGLYTLPHSDALRDCHQALKFGPEHSRQARHATALRKLKYLRRLTRAIPGQSLGVSARQASMLRLFRGGRQRAWRPGEDDIL